MLATAVMACLLWAGIAFRDVAREPKMHRHAFIEVLKSSITADGQLVWARGATMPQSDPINPSPFWPPYARHVLGLRWRRLNACGPGRGRPAETCEFDRPEILGGSVSPEMHAETVRLEVESGGKAGTIRPGHPFDALIQ